MTNNAIKQKLKDHPGRPVKVIVDSTDDVMRIHKLTEEGYDVSYETIGRGFSTKYMVKVTG